MSCNISLLEISPQHKFQLCSWYIKLVPILWPTEPEFAFLIAESFPVTGPVAVEVDGTVLSSLEQLDDTNSWQQIQVTTINLYNDKQYNVSSIVKDGDNNDGISEMLKKTTNTIEWIYLLEMF